VRHAAVTVAVAWLFHCLYKMRRTPKIRAGWSKRQLAGRGGVWQLPLAKYTIQSKSKCSFTKPVFEHLLKKFSGPCLYVVLLSAVRWTLEVRESPFAILLHATVPLRSLSQLTAIPQPFPPYSSRIMRGFLTTNNCSVTIACEKWTVCHFDTLQIPSSGCDFFLVAWYYFVNTYCLVVTVAVKCEATLRI
jgi:hypothetical protein